MKIRGLKFVMHVHVLHLSSWKDLFKINDKRYGDYENPILQYMYSATGLESRK